MAETPEQRARRTIDSRLRACGWAVQDYTRVDLSSAPGIALREVPLTSGRCDYLLVANRVPLGIVEAKKEGETLSTVADQSAFYADNLPDLLRNLLPPGLDRLPFLYPSTGAETLFPDDRDRLIAGVKAPAGPLGRSTGVPPALPTGPRRSMRLPFADSE